MQHGVQQHGGVAVGKHEAVAIQPGGIGGIIAQKFLPQAIGDRRQSHRRARMARVGLLHGVDGQSSNRVNAQRVQLLSRHQNLFTGYHAIPLLQFGDFHAARLAHGISSIIRVSDYRKGSIRRKCINFREGMDWLR